MCLVCLSLCDSGQGDNRFVFRGVRVMWSRKGRGGGGGEGGWLEGEVVVEGGRGSWGKGDGGWGLVGGEGVVR